MTVDPIPAKMSCETDRYAVQMGSGIGPSWHLYSAAHARRQTGTGSDVTHRFRIDPVGGGGGMGSRCLASTGIDEGEPRAHSRGEQRDNSDETSANKVDLRQLGKFEIYTFLDSALPKTKPWLRA